MAKPLLRRQLDANVGLLQEIVYELHGAEHLADVARFKEKRSIRLPPLQVLPRHLAVFFMKADRYL